MIVTLPHLHVISRVLVVVGVVLLVAGVAMSLQPVLTLVGAMMLIAGLVKMLVLWIWTHLARMGTDDHHPEQAI